MPLILKDFRRDFRRVGVFRGLIFGSNDRAVVEPIKRGEVCVKLHGETLFG
jgi:hypothetical protein